MARSGSMILGICVGAAVAGPVFLTAMILAGLYLKLPAPVVVAPDQVGIFLFILFPATVVGAAVALPANAMGALLMAYLSDHCRFARSSYAWALAGGLIGAFLARGMTLGDGKPELIFALVVTCAICASLCNRWVIWDAEE